MADSAIWLYAQLPTERMDTINILVIGALGVGKSSLIQRALRLSRLPTSSTSSVRQDLDGIPHVVSLIEVDLEYFDIDDVAVPGQQIQWPKQINGQPVPRLDGALVLYDVMNKDSIRELPPTLCESCDHCASS
jgi:GTPase SAR1 family protein